MKKRGLKLDPGDDVVVALEAMAPGDLACWDGQSVEVQEAVLPGHKIAVRAIGAGSPLKKYGWPIGKAKTPIAAGQWVHLHNLETLLGADESYEYRPAPAWNAPSRSAETFQGYLRA